MCSDYPARIPFVCQLTINGHPAVSKACAEQSGCTTVVVTANSSIIVSATLIHGWISYYDGLRSVAEYGETWAKRDLAILDGLSKPDCPCQFQKDEICTFDENFRALVDRALYLEPHIRNNIYSVKKNVTMQLSDRLYCPFE